MKLYLLAMSLALSGCGSFNIYNIHYPKDGVMMNPQPIQKSPNATLMGPTPSALSASALRDETIRSKSAIETDVGAMPMAIGGTTSSNVLCPVYQLPLLAEMPQLPYKELEMASGDRDKMEVVARKHISDLRAYISRTKKALVESHEKYLKDCQAYLATPHQKTVRR